jgi:hypothetical protein
MALDRSTRAISSGAGASSAASTTSVWRPAAPKAAVRRSITTPEKATCGLATSGMWHRGRAPANSRRRPSAWSSGIEAEVA